MDGVGREIRSNCWCYSQEEKETKPHYCLVTQATLLLGDCAHVPFLIASTQVQPTEGRRVCLVHSPSRQRNDGDWQCAVTLQVAPTCGKQTAVRPSVKLGMFLFTLELPPMEAISPMFRMGFPTSVTLI